MRTRLAHTLSFWLLGAVALSVLAMGGLSAWNLRQGFNAYLQARDLERLDAFVALEADRLAQADGSTADAAPPPDMQALLRELEMRLGVPAPAQPRRVPPDGLPDGRPWAGPPIDGDVPGVIERPIVLRGEVVARALLRPLALAPDAIDRQFLLSQYLGIAAVAAVLLGLALVVALWLARQWVRPLLDSMHADDRDVSDRAIDSHVKNVRHKIQALDPDFDCIASIYGVGYCFDAPLRAE